MTGAPVRPRRWTTEIDGIKWLPRLIDKARMTANGTLGAYLMGHSPVDYALLKKLGITTDDFVALVSTQSDDAGVLAALRARGFDEAGVRRWSDRFETTYKGFIPVWDLDEGYVAPNGPQKVLLPVMRALEAPAMALVRKLRPQP